MKAIVQHNGDGLVLHGMASRIEIRVAAKDTGGGFRSSRCKSGFERFFVEMADQLRALGREPTPADMAAIAPPLWTRFHVEQVALDRSIA